MKIIEFYQYDFFVEIRNHYGQGRLAVFFTSTKEMFKSIFIVENERKLWKN